MGQEHSKHLSCCSEGRLVTEGSENKNGIYKDNKYFQESFQFETLQTEEDNANLSTNVPSAIPSQRVSQLVIENLKQNKFSFEKRIQETLDKSHSFKINKSCSHKKNISLDTLTKVSAIIKEETENSQAIQQTQENIKTQQSNSDSQVVSEIIIDFVSYNWNLELVKTKSNLKEKRKDTLIGYEISSQLSIDEDKMIESLCLSMQQITPNIWIGNKASVGYTIGAETQKTIKQKEQAKQNLKEQKISHILVCCENYQQYSDEEFNYYQYQIPDDPKFDIKNSLEKSSQILEQIEKNNEIAIVHCSAGASRSATIVIGYLMKKYRKKFEVVRNYVLSKRNCINVCNFEQNLKEWEAQIFNQKQEQQPQTLKNNKTKK